MGLVGSGLCGEEGSSPEGEARPDWPLSGEELSTRGAQARAPLARLLRWLGPRPHWPAFPTLTALAFMHTVSEGCEAGRRAALDVGVVPLLLSWMNQLVQQKPFKKKDNDRLRCLKLVTDILLSVCEEDSDGCCAICDAGGIPVVLKVLSDPQLSPKALQRSKKDLFRQYICHGVWSILRSLLVHSSATKAAFTAQGLPLAWKFQKCKEKVVRVKALLCLAELSTETAKMRDVDAKLLLRLLHRSQHSTAYPFPPAHIIRGLGSLARDSGLRSRLLKLGLIPALDPFLLQPRSDRELKATAVALWAAAFSPAAYPRVMKQPYAFQKLQRIVYHDDAEIREAAKGVLWTLSFYSAEFDRNKDRSPSARLYDGGKVGLGPVTPDTPDTTSTDFDRPSTTPILWDVMLSFNPHSSTLVLPLAHFLKDMGLNLFLHNQQTDGETLETRMDAVEQSRVLLMACDPEYLDSPICRNEAEYASYLGKRIIVLNLAAGNPESWQSTMGSVFGSLVWPVGETEAMVGARVMGLIQEETPSPCSICPDPKATGKPCLSPLSCSKDPIRTGWGGGQQWKGGEWKTSGGDGVLPDEAAEQDGRQYERRPLLQGPQPPAPSALHQQHGHLSHLPPRHAGALRGRGDRELRQPGREEEGASGGLGVRPQAVDPGAEAGLLPHRLPGEQVDPARVGVEPADPTDDGERPDALHGGDAGAAGPGDGGWGPPPPRPRSVTRSLTRQRYKQNNRTAPDPNAHDPEKPLSPDPKKP